MRMFFVLAVTIAFCSSAAEAAMTCTARQKVCIGYCNSRTGNSEGCANFCASSMSQCMQSGCWISQVNSKCGFTRS